MGIFGGIASQLIAAQEVFTRAQAGQLTIVDIRAPEEWRQIHSAKVQRGLLTEVLIGVINIMEGMAGSGAGVGWIRQGVLLESCSSN